jgi:phosphate:Na+ symporter
MEIPAAALAALRKETIHLYDKSLEAIVHAMNLHRSEIFSVRDIDEIVGHSKPKIKIDVDQVYQQNIKSLYGEIIRYASVTQKYMGEEANNEVYELKLTARKIIEMVKDVRELQKNLNYYARRHNTVTIGEYDKLRAQLISVLRKIQQVRSNEGDAEDILTQIEVQRDIVNKSEIRLNHEVDALIRDNKIDSSTASSLINDIGFAHSISKKLLSAAITLWVRNEEVKKLGDEYGYQ